MWITFYDEQGAATDGVNLDNVMSWSSGLTEDKIPYVVLQFVVMGSDGTRGLGEKPWSMRLTGAERQQFLAAVLPQAAKKNRPVATG